MKKGGQSVEWTTIAEGHLLVPDASGGHIVTWKHRDVLGGKVNRRKLLPDTGRFEEAVELVLGSQLAEMIVIVCGGRFYADKTHVYATLDALHAERCIGLVREGGANGADLLGRSWAMDRGIDVITYWANWRGRKGSGGPVRNGAMLRAGADIVVAFPGDVGTADMVRQATKIGVAVMQVPPRPPAPHGAARKEG